MAPNAKLNPIPARSALSRLWDPKEILQIIDQRVWSDRDPHLRIDVKGIRDRRKTLKPLTPGATPERAAKRVRHENTNAICCLTIWEGSGPEVLVQDQVNATITNQSDSVTGERRAKVDLDEPFVVSPRDLAPKGKGGTTAIRYSMQITLQAASLSDKWPPVDLGSIPAPVNRSQQVGDGVEVYPIFVVSYPRLPHVPTTEDEGLLPVTALQDFKQLTPRLAFHVDMNWVEAATPLEVYNRVKKVSTAKKKITPREPTRSPSADIPQNLEVETTWRVRDQFIEVDDCIFVGYVCPLCNNRQFEGSEIYWFHLVQSHDLFKFRVTVKYPETSDADSLVRVFVKLDLKDPAEARRDENNKMLHKFKQKGTEFGADEIKVLKTYKSFFDLEQYLKRDKDRHWGGKRDRKAGLNGIGIGATDSNHVSRRGTPIVVDLTRPANLVPDLPPPQRRKYPVPPAPDGVKFFSLRVKRPLRQGELLSESDDDIDDSWVLQKHSDRIDSFEDLTTEERNFLKRHDKHMLRENVSSNLHYRDALVRFCRLNQQWLQRPEARLEFAKKLTALHLEGVIKVQQIFEYLEIIDAPVRNNHEERADPDLEETKTTAPPDAGCLYAFCDACEEPIRTAKDIVRCTNPTCTNDYHKACTKVSSKASAGSLARWRCSHCPSAPDVSAEDEQAARVEAYNAERPSTNHQSPELALLNKFAPDHLSRLPGGRRLGPGPGSASRYQRSTVPSKPSYGDARVQGRVQDSEGEGESDEHAEALKGLPIERDKGERESRGHGDDVSGNHVVRDAGYQGPEYLSPRHRRHIADPSVSRREEELKRRITDDNYGEWMQRRKITDDADLARPRRPHEL